jgi:hypothetical protein
VLESPSRATGRFPLRIAIVTNLESRGLTLDARLLEAFLASRNHSVVLWQFDEPHEETVDLVIFLELIVRPLVSRSLLAPWFIPNLEFLRDTDIRVVKLAFGKVLCKTREALRVCEPLFGELAVLTGFLARDRFDASIPREDRFLHVAGNSRVKGTEAVIDAWRWRRNGKLLDAPLTVVAGWLADNDLPEHVTLLRDVDDEQLKFLQNSHRFHLQPSQTEGFGHVLHESLSVGAELLSTDAPPMNELFSSVMAPFDSTTFNHARLYQVSALDIYCWAELMLKRETSYREMMALTARDEFRANNLACEDSLDALLGKIAPRVSLPSITTASDSQLPMHIAFLGNFEAAESTENLVHDALTRGLGHSVEILQENKVTLTELKRAMSLNDLFLWVRTPGWLGIGDADMDLLLDYLRRRGTPTVSLHLDKFWGIPEREEAIGKIPFWHTQFVWTADGSRQQEFAARGVNHYWLRPAMSEIHLHPGRIRPQYQTDIGFVGARHYHREYPFRGEMLNFLEHSYGKRFRHVEGVRGHELNDVYASLGIVVGDCIFAGTPRYWSDRVAETCGRGGFLLHPQVEGLDVPVATYEAQNLLDLKRAIDFWLEDPEGRKRKAKECMEYVRGHDTWTLRMAEILQVACK